MHPENKTRSNYVLSNWHTGFREDTLQQSNFNLNDLVDEEITSNTINSIDNMQENPVSVIYQSGYLTIKGYNKEFQLYRLGFPNREVENGFTRFLIPLYSNVSTVKSGSYISKLVTTIRRGEVEQFMALLEVFFADSDYRIAGEAELYFQNVIFVVFRLIGLYVEVERPTSDGRMDLIVKTSDYIYIFEFKLDKSADDALQQIEDKGYALPFATDPRRLFKIGVNFSSQHRRITEWKMAEK